MSAFKLHESTTNFLNILTQDNIDNNTFDKIR